jgi:hypothetical protein
MDFDLHPPLQQQQCKTQQQQQHHHAHLHSLKMGMVSSTRQPNQLLLWLQKTNGHTL